MSISLVRSSSQYITAPSPVAAAPFSLTAWVYPTSSESEGATIFSMENASGVVYRGYAVSNVIRMEVNGTSYAELTTPALTLNAWNLVWFTAYLSSGNTVLRCSIDNATSSTTFVATASIPQNCDKLVIGAYDNSGYTGFWNGRIAEVGLWNVLLSSTYSYVNLRRGAYPLAAERANLKLYSPFINDFHDLFGASMTPVNTPTAEAHPRIIRGGLGRVRT